MHSIILDTYGYIEHKKLDSKNYELEQTNEEFLL